MTEQTIITVPISTADDMLLLGKILGTTLFDPRLYPEQGNKVVTLYGKHQAGKNRILEGAEKVCPDDVIYIPHDFGYDTYPGDAYIFYPGTGKNVPLPPPDLTRSYGAPLIDKSAKPSRIYYFEHSPVPFAPDISIVISWPGDPKNTFYLERMHDQIVVSAKKLGRENGPLSTVALMLKEAKNDVCSYASDRIVRISIPSDIAGKDEVLRTTAHSIHTRFAARL
ncbi:MAG: hypothetical protein PHE27_00560 [Alphaproteobacteria bacterium]|nr:hypothetical protein [Alphaproteobacteria bacterium]